MNCKNALAVRELTLKSVVYSVDSRENQVQSSIALKTVTSHSLGILGFILEIFPAGKIVWESLDRPGNIIYPISP